MGPVRPAGRTGGGGFEHFYGFIGGETNQYAPAIYDGTDAGRARPDAGGGLPLHRGHDRPGDRLGPPAEGADARQAVLRLLRARRDARAAPRADGVVGQVQGPVRRTAGTRCARRRSPARRSSGVVPADAELTARPRRDPGLGRHARRPQAGPRPPDGGLRRLPGAHRPPRRPAHRRPRASSGSSTTRSSTTSSATTAPPAEGTPQRLLQRADRPQRRRRPRDDRVHGLAHRRLRHARGLQPLRGRLGPRDGHALPVDQAGRLALGRHPQRHDRPLAGRHQGQGRGPHAVPPRHRHRRRRCSTRPGCPSPRSCTACSRCRCEGVSMAYSFDDAAAAERRETQYFEMFCNRGIYHQGWTAVTRHSTPWVMAPMPAARRRRLGALRAPTTGRRRTTSRPSSPRSWPSCSACS